MGFFATSHGKGHYDGLEGTLKPEVARASLKRTSKNQIHTPAQLNEYAKDSLRGLNGEFLPTDEVASKRKSLQKRFKAFSVVSRITSFHAILP